MSAITDRLGIGDEIRELKLGRTFTSRDANNSFHTIRYDFKPASVDTMKSAVLDIEGNNKVSVTTPNVEGSGTSETVFKGSRKPHQKECVLIIDHETGEITLEKLSQNIIVKRTRQQNTSKAHKQLSQRPNTPIETKKSVPPQPQHKPNSPLTTKSQNSPNKQKLSPNKASNGQQFSQQHRNSPSQPISPSMPTLSALSANMQPSVSASTSISTSTPTPATKRDINEALGLSDSSSDSSDHESSSSSSDTSSDSSSEDELTNKPLTHHKPLNNSTNNITANTNTKLHNISKAKAKSSSFSSDSESDNETFNRKPNGMIANHNGTNGTTSALPSMPKFSQLSEDLQLSESGSDSED